MRARSPAAQLAAVRRLNIVNMSILWIGRYLARGVLFLLVFIHWILPFTPVNENPEARIIVASIILGASFLWIGIKSVARPGRYFAIGLILLLAVYAISDLSGASPLAEGIVVKVLFVLFLVLGIVSARLSENVEPPNNSLERTGDAAPEARANRDTGT